METIKDHLMEGEETKQYDDIYVTQYRIIQEKDSLLRKDFHDLLFRNLESIEYGDQLKTSFSLIGILFILLGTAQELFQIFNHVPYLAGYVDSLSLYIIAAFMLLSSYILKDKKMIFRGNNTTIISYNAQYNIIKDIREAQERFFQKAEGEKQIKALKELIAKKPATLSEQMLADQETQQEPTKKKVKKTKNKKELMSIL